MASPYLTSQWNKQKVLWADRSRCPPALRQALLTGTKVACFYPVCKGETHPCGVGLAIAAACHSEHPIKSLAKGQELPALKKNWKSLCDLFTLLNSARLFPWDKNWTLKCHQWNKKVVYLHKKRDQMVVCLGFFLPLSALIAVVKSFDWSSNVWQIVVFVLPTDWSCAVLSLVSELSIPVPWGEIRGKTWGPEHGHPVLCLHGWADNCGSFNTLIPFLPKGNSPQTGQGWEKLSPVGCCSRG